MSAPPKPSSRNRLERRLAGLRRTGARALAPYITAGDGGLQRTLEVLRALDRPRVACVELGLPFSDALADGPELQAAADRSLAAGTTFEGVLDVLRQLRGAAPSSTRCTGVGAGSSTAPSVGPSAAVGRRPGQPACELPVLIMSYANPLLCRGWDASLAALSAAGADGVIVPDLPIEEGTPMIAAARAVDLCPVFLVAPTTADERLAAIVAACRGFVYAIPRHGITGTATTFGADTAAFMSRVRRAAGELPVALGFGIRDAAGVRAAADHAELAVVGSAFVAHLQRHTADLDGVAHGGLGALAAAVASFIDPLCEGLPERKLNP